MSRVHQIFTAFTAGAPMMFRAEVHAVPGAGLDGDRYSLGMGKFSPPVQDPDHELTLIELENVEDFARLTGLPFTAMDSRRNIVTVGVALNALIGQVFQVGGVNVRGIRLCEPCRYLAKHTYKDILPALNGKAGLRAQILSSGVIRVGDRVAT